MALFSGETGACLRWRTDQMLNVWSKAWMKMLGDVPARPERAPAVIEIETIVRVPVPAYPNYELRAVALRPMSESCVIRFRDGWPA